MIVARIDENGYFIEDVIIEGKKIPGDCVVERPNTKERGFYKPKWTGTEWVEGLTEEEIEEMKNQPKLPTVEERLQIAEQTILGLMDIIMMMGGM